MKLSTLTSSDLHKLVKLISKREVLAANLLHLEAQIDALSGEATPAPAKRGRRPRKSKSLPGLGKEGKSGKLKNAILRSLSEAGDRGMSVGELHKKLNVKTNNLYSWFYTTGRKVARLRKNSSGKYVYNG